MPVSSPQYVSDPVTDFNGAVMNNKLEEEVFRDGITYDLDFNEGWSSTENEAPALLFSSEEGWVLHSVMGEIPSVHAFEDVKMVGYVVYANGLKSQNAIRTQRITSYVRTCCFQAWMI